MRLAIAFLLCFLAVSPLSEAAKMKVTKDVPYVVDGHERHVLDIYAPTGAKYLPVVFWIHGGWQAGDKSEVKSKPQAFVDRGCVFVSTNYRFLPHVDMATLIKDVATSAHWVHDHIAAGVARPESSKGVASGDSMS